MEWTEETIARLKALWQEGLSTAEIGRQLGITKNAVVGKAHRLGLPARPSPIRREKAKTTVKSTGEEGAEQPKKASAPRRAVKAVAEPSAAASTSAPVAASEASVAAPDEQKVSLVSVKASEPDVVATQPAEPPKPKPATIVQLVPAVKEQSVPVQQERKVTSAASRAAAQRLTSIMEPRRRTASCCWPLGDPGTPGFHFCGATPLPGKPYCAEHAAMAYVKLRDRRDSA